nr:Bardet-Biedl syndrome 7 protein-like [Dermatophagoides farinae]
MPTSTMNSNQNSLSSSSSSFTRFDYIQVGLTSRNAMKLIRKLSPHLFEVAIGDHSGSLHYFSINMDKNQADTIFKTLPGPNAKINCIDAYSGLKQNGSTKILIVCGPSMIKGFNKKGKQFFGLELNNLTEPIKMFQMHRQPDEIHVLGQYIYNSYLVNTELVASGGTGGSNSSYNSVVRSRHYYVCPAQINDFVLMEERFNRRIIPILACQDRLLRILKDSQCNFEIEVCGIPSVIRLVPQQHMDSPEMMINNSDNSSVKKSNNNDINLCYGTMDGKISLVTFQFQGKDQLEPVHHWEVPVEGIRQPITCLCFSEIQPEFYVGRADGTIEIWRLNETIHDGDVEQQVDLTATPTMIDSYNCSESITNLLPIIIGQRNDLLLLCSTFTGMVFGLLQHGQTKQLKQLNPNYLMISKENADRIRSLQDECKRMEKQLENERKNYAKHTAMASSMASATNNVDQTQINTNDGNLSVLPFFAINDSFVLHNDASYILMLEVEVSIDVVVLHCDLPLDLIDCERNSAVISFNDDQMIGAGGFGDYNINPDQVLVTFRCQTNTSRLEIRLRPVEGQHGTISVYVISRITPKSCQARSYQIQPLSLHKRQYSNTSIDHPNRLSITGQFSLADAHTWLRLCIPEIPEKLSRTLSDVESEILYYISTMTKSILICNCGRGVITMTSDNVSTISILKDFITREATRQSIEIEIDVDLIDKSLGSMLVRLYPNIRQLIRRKHRDDLLEALADLQSSDADIARQLLIDLNLNHQDGDDESIVDNLSSDNRRQDVMIGLDRLYGIITDLFIDYHKLKNSSMITSLVSMAKQKLPEMIEMIEKIVFDSFDSECMDMNNFSSTTFSIESTSIIDDDGHSITTTTNIDNTIDDGLTTTTTTNDSTNNNQTTTAKSSNTIIRLSQDPNVNIFIEKLFQFWNLSI